MHRLKGFLLSLLSLSFMAWLIPAAATEQNSYYFSIDEATTNESRVLSKVSVADWNQSRTVLEQSWISEDALRKRVFDISTFPVNQLIDANLDHLEMLAQGNIIFLNSNSALEQPLTDLIVNGHPAFAKRDNFLRMRAAEILLKLKPQNPVMLKPMMTQLKESKNWILRQYIAKIFIKASPRLDAETVNNLVQVMQNDKDTSVRGLASIAVMLHSEDNLENLKKLVHVLMVDHRDIMHVLHPYYFVLNFIEQRQNSYLETPLRTISPKLKKTLMDLIRDYRIENPEHLNNGSMTRNKLIRSLEM